MATYYIDKTLGSDSNSGTSASPYQTINKGIAVASANDTLILAPSTSDYVWTTQSLPAGLTIKCLTIPDMVKGTWARLSAGGGTVRYTVGGDFTAENIVFYNYSNGAADSAFYYNHISGIDQVIQFSDCVFDTIKGSNSTASRGGFVGNNGSVGAITQNSITVNFDRCLFYNIKCFNSSAGYTMTHFGSSSHSANVRECTWYDDGTGVPATAIIGYYVTGSYATAYFRNSIIISDNSGTTYFNSNYTGTVPLASTVENCCYYGGISTTNATLTNSINQDPKFLDKGAKDFRLKPSSPCIDKGKLV